MMDVNLNSPVDVRVADTKVLVDALGPVEFACFIQQFENGYGNYTKEKYDQLEPTTPLNYAQLGGTFYFASLAYLSNSCIINFIFSNTLLFQFLPCFSSLAYFHPYKIILDCQFRIILSSLSSFFHMIIISLFHLNPMLILPTPITRLQEILTTSNY